jgi:hypothetical protein
MEDPLANRGGIGGMGRNIDRLGFGGNVQTLLYKELEMAKTKTKKKRSVRIVIKRRRAGAAKAA